MPVTYFIMGFTILISIWAFSDHEMFHRLKHWPYAEAQRGEHYRWLTGGLLHGDYTHLIFNMLTLYFFGPTLEHYFGIIFPGAQKFMYLTFYTLAIIASSSATFVKYRESPHFASIGASGATAAVLFACILFDPTNGVGLFLPPIPIPGFIFAVFYLWYSNYAAQRGGDNIDHTAHYFGALFGFFFPIVFKPALVGSFLEQVAGWFNRF
jgi:membrane associated rhomboid family serine protease